MTSSSCIDNSPDAPVECSIEPATPGSPETDLSSAATSPVIKRKIASGPGKDEASTLNRRPVKGKAKGEWDAQRRLKLWGAFNACADIKWDEVAAKMGDGATGKMCREQWQRGTGKKILKALQDD